MAKNPGRGNKGARKNNIPNVVGVAKTTAQTTITNAGFTYVITNENTTNANLNETIKSQDIPAGEVRSLGTNINLVNYTFSFTPFGAFGFTPFAFTPVFAFAPQGPVFSFSPPSCIHGDTLIDTPNGKIAAKNLNIGDAIYSFRLNEIPEASEDGYTDFDYIGFISESLIATEKTETTIVDIVSSEKNTLVCFNSEIDKLFSTSQPFFVKRDNAYEILPSGAIEAGDYLISIQDDLKIQETIVESIEYISESSIVYQFSCEPQDWFIAGDYLVHNK